MPGVTTPLYNYGAAPETVAHVFEGCSARPDAAQLQEEEGPVEDLLRKIQTGKGARPVVRWLLKQLPEYRLALTYLGELTGSVLGD